MKLGSGNIVNCCKGRNKTSAGLVWSYTFEFPIRKKHVDCYSLTGELISSYESGCEAARKTNILAGSINECIRGNGYTAGGFIWVKHGEPLKLPNKKHRIKGPESP